MSGLGVGPNGGPSGTAIGMLSQNQFYSEQKVKMPTLKTQGNTTMFNSSSPNYFAKLANSKYSDQ